ncbi:hypothetical protein EDD17DRAFT_1469223, partial [Pisolithus thermaeus]
TASYAFTGNWSQGQTLPYVVVNIVTSLMGGSNLFSLYVALSRSSDQIQLFGDFNTIFLTSQWN